MIALGWTCASTGVPAPLTLADAGRLRVILAPKDHCNSPRARLALAQACFEAGVDFVPLSATGAVTAATAKRIARSCAQDVQAQMAQISGAGQLLISVALAHSPPPAPTPTTGRAWLQARKNHLSMINKRVRDAHVTLDALTTPLPYPCTAGQETPVTCTRAVLVPRGDVAAARTVLQGLGSRLHPDPALRVDITGLWPAFGFVKRPEPDTVAYA